MARPRKLPAADGQFSRGEFAPGPSPSLMHHQDRFRRSAARGTGRAFGTKRSPIRLAASVRVSFAESVKGEPNHEVVQESRIDGVGVNFESTRLGASEKVSRRIAGAPGRGRRGTPALG